MHACRVTHHGLYTDKYIRYMSSTCSHTSYGMLAEEPIGFLQPGDNQAKLMAPSARMRSSQCTQQCFYFGDIDKESNL